ncbi:MAG TPA: hypothetical protein VML96_06240 [Egibacteraceae bacterium]|nr:hypothetical protein [Egibacteraceae bacterium]
MISAAPPAPELAQPAAPQYARVIVDVAPAHLDRPFDYLIPDGQPLALGQRVRVSFAGRRRTGWVVGLADAPQTDPSRVRPILDVQGETQWFDAEDLRLFRWVAQRYAGTLADVLRHALPPRIAAVERATSGWSAPAAIAPAERPPCPVSAWRPYAASAMLKAAAGGGGAFHFRALRGDDRAAMAADLVARCLAGGRSAVVLAPDPSSPVTEAALAVAGDAGADLRGEPAARLRAFLRARAGHARVAVGERAGVFAPVRDLGLVVVDDEANPAFKERRSPRHNAREVALARSRMAGAACVLLGDLPSARVWRLIADGHVAAVRADRATERDRAPLVEVADLSDPRPGARRARLAQRTAQALSSVVRDGGAAVVLAARGGQGAALACRGCGRRLLCPVCDGSLRPAREPVEPEAAWQCPTCSFEGPAFACPDCGEQRTAPLAAGAGRLAQELARSHPRAEVARMEGFDATGPQSRPAIAVMTRGSVVTRPAWLAGQDADVTVIPDADAMLGRATLDAGEDALRLWLAAGHWSRRIVAQTRDPRHPAVQALVRWDPDGYWRAEAERRAALGYPPARSLVRITAPVADAQDIVRSLRKALPAADEVLGPDLDGGAVVKSLDLRGTLDALAPLRQDWARDDRKVRTDVDPLEG